MLPSLILIAQDVRLLSGYLTVAAILFGLGVAGIIVRRNPLSTFLSLAVCVQGVVLVLVAFGNVHRSASGEVFALFLILVAVVQGCVLLAFANSRTETNNGESLIDAERSIEIDASEVSDD